jgi:hypothetical protein
MKKKHQKIETISEHLNRLNREREANFEMAFQFFVIVLGIIILGYLLAAFFIGFKIPY